MTRHRPFATALFAVLVGLAALPQASQAGTENRELPAFSEISVRNGATVQVSQGEQASVRVTADDAVLPLLETVVEKDRLEIRWKRGENAYDLMRRHGRVTVAVVMPRLTALSVAGSGDVEVAAFNTPKLSVSVAGSGSARLDKLVGDELGVRVAGSGDIRGSGQVSSLTISVAGSGDVGLAELKADEVSVRIAGSGDVKVHADKTLKVSIAGSGDIVYSGDPVVTRSVAGSGNISKR